MMDESKIIIDLEGWKRDEKTYFHPDLGKPGSGWYDRGHVKLNHRCVSLYDRYGIRFTPVCEADSEIEVTVYCMDTSNISDEKLIKYTYKTKVYDHDKELTVPLRYFNIPDNDRGILGFVCGVSFSCPVKGLMAVKGVRFFAEAERRSQNGDPGDELEYTINVKSSVGEVQHLQVICLDRTRDALEWAHSAETELQPYSECRIKIKTKMSDIIPPGGYEKKKILISSNGIEQEIELYAVRSLRHPYILHDEAGWNEVKENTKKYKWAENKLAAMKKTAEEWVKPHPGDKYLFTCDTCEKAMVCAYVYKLTGEEKFADKVMSFVRDIIDPMGYQHNERVCEKELVHEGSMFRIIAVICDLLYDRFSEEDLKNIDIVFRRFIGIINRRREQFDITNWILSMLSGQLACASFLHDRAEIDDILFGTCGIADNIGMGILSDGWWCECTTGYCMFCAKLLMDQAVMLKVWGIDLAHMNVSPEYGREKGIPQKDGMCTDIYGGNTRSYRNIRMLIDSLIRTMDYRGVVMGINDSAEQRFTGDSGLDLAYRIYGDPRYALAVKFGGEDRRDLIFGVGELPEDCGGFDEKSCIFENGGIAILRTQHGSPEERTSIALKFGTHGGAHGHYDRTNLLAAMRYGRSLTNPETIWYLYRNFMYKFYMQTSITHNMVTVDLKQQKPEPSDVRLFYGGEDIQVMSVENTAVWSYPPYGGWRVISNETFADRAWREGRYVPIPEDAPEYGALTQYTEPVTSLRTVVLTDDFVVVFDELTAEKEHVFDCMYHLREITGVEGAKLKYHKEQLTEDPLSSAQFVTDCNFYDTDDVVKVTTDVEYTEEQIYAKLGANMWRSCYNEPGRLKTDLYYLGGGELILGTDASFNNVSKRLFYKVCTDGKTAAEGKFGAWILGRDTIDVQLEGIKELSIEIRTENGCIEVDEEHEAEKTIFLADAWIMTRNGDRIPLSKLDMVTENIDNGQGCGKDYTGNEVIISGKHFKEAVPANPDDIYRPGKLSLSLEGLDAISFHSEIGGNYPINGGKNHQRLISMRKSGVKVGFVSVMELYKDEPVIADISGGEGYVEVKTKDGRSKRVIYNNASTGINVSLEEYRNGIWESVETASEC